ncbi:putative hemolysin [Vibrio ishigakensis]|uniref:Putative hemolysin n=1 Tax=Vibrio ishigakensis TaxID=1481914 RepID=A0A0B8Q355_9VIBR|nr:putative hemolysin [Vibrio ishigakensis]
MSLVENLFIIMALILISCFFSMSEISLAAARKIRLRQLADDGDQRALWFLVCKRTLGISLRLCKLA